MLKSEKQKKQIPPEAVISRLSDGKMMSIF